MSNILIIEDDPAITIGLKESLKTENYNVYIEEDGIKGFEQASSGKYDLLVLDIMLPSKSGFDICKDLRMNSINIPIIMLTAKLGEADKVLGLELGADDYVTKPFSIRELIARVRAILRRSTAVKGTPDALKFEDVEINFRKMECFKSGSKVNMSLKEYEIMKFFSSHIDDVITRDMLLDKVWGYETFPTTRPVDNYILMLRKKLENNPSVPKHILTIHSAGYKFVK